MIWASIKMGLQDKRLLLPSVLTVFINFFFFIVIGLQAKERFGGSAQGLSQSPQELLKYAQSGGMAGVPMVNGSMDQGGFGAMASLLTPDTAMLVACIGSVWWLTDKFLEGVTTALVYSHLTEGRGSGRFSTACQAVVSSLPAIVMLGFVTLVAKKLCRWMRDRRGSGMLGIGANLLSGIVEVFWTLAGHLILPAIVIEGTSFWGAMKRADRIAQGNLLTIGVGEVGVDTICRFVNFLVYSVGVAGGGGAYYLYTQHTPIALPAIITGALAWGALVVVVNGMSLYIRAAFYTCLYVWAIEVESVEDAERLQVAPPAPLAQALAA